MKPSAASLVQSRCHTSIETPIGWVVITGDVDGIASVYFAEASKGQTEEVPECLTECASQLQEYFKGDRTDFDLKLRPQGTDFQTQVWNALLGIPYGQTCSYLDVALAIQNRQAVRAVGAANGQNPITVIVPCHRVIGSNGKLTGYGGELWRKKWLLEHESNITYGKQTSLFG